MRKYSLLVHRVGLLRFLWLVLAGLSCAAPQLREGLGPDLNQPVQLIVNPAAIRLTPGGTQQFSATARFGDGSIRTLPVSYQCTGGIISPSGLYAADTVPGEYRVIAIQQGGTLADTSFVTVMDSSAKLIGLTLTPDAVTLVVGGAQQFAVSGRLSDGTSIPVTANYTVGGGTITTGGLYTAGATPGAYSVVAVSQSGGLADTAVVSLIQAPPATGTVDPSALPVGTGQRPGSGSYGRGLAAGGTYTDPLTGVVVVKLTSATVPAANGGMYHGYSEGGPNLSLPWLGGDGQVYYTAKVGGWLVDVQYTTLALRNWRRVAYDGEIGLAFSLNWATPRIAYVVQGKEVHRYNTATNLIEDTGHWPWVIGASGLYPQWLQTQMNDTWLVTMLQSTRTVVAFRPSDGFQQVITEAAAGVSIDEPHLDREVAVAYLSTNSGTRNKIVNLETGAYTNPADPGNANGPLVNDDHNSPMRGKIVGISWTPDAAVVVDYKGEVLVVPGGSPTDWGGDYHQAGQWVFDNPGEYFVVDQWQRDGAYPVRLGMIGLKSVATGEVRLIAASGAIGTGYNTGGQPHPTIAPDGKLVMWTSNMNGSGRYDTFLARLPVR